jgi:antitoxin MazE
MKVKVARWGNSLAVRLPKRLADDLGLAPGKTIDLEKDGTRLVMEASPPRNVPKYQLEELLSQVKPGSAPPYEDWGILPSEWPEEDWSDVAPSDVEWETWKREAEARGALRQRRRA